VAQAHGERMEPLRAHAAGPPQRRAVDIDGDRWRHGPHTNTLLHQATIVERELNLEFKPIRHASIAGQLKVHPHLDRGALGGALRDERTDLIDARRAPRIDPARTEAARRQLRAPIPAEAAGALAQERVRRPITIDRPLTQFARAAEHGRDRPIQVHANRVADRAHDAAHIEAPWPELVLDMTEAAPVEPDRTAGVDRFEDEIDALVVTRARLEIHRAVPAPRCATDPLLRHLAIAAVGIRNRTRTEQGIMHAAGHRRGEPLAHQPLRHDGRTGGVRLPIGAMPDGRTRMCQIWPAQPWLTVKRANGPTCSCDRLDHGARTLARHGARPSDRALVLPRPRVPAARTRSEPTLTRRT